MGVGLEENALVGADTVDLGGPDLRLGDDPDQLGRLTDASDNETFGEPEIPLPFLHDEIVRLTDQRPREQVPDVFERTDDGRIALRRRDA